MYHDHDGLAHMVLHELSHVDSFGLSRAGYFIENPDFDCLKGVAGYDSNECPVQRADVWNDPVAFMQRMQSSPFQQKVSSFSHTSLPRKEDTIDEAAVNELGHMLGMQNPSFFTWRMKHGNNGILIFEDNGSHIAHHRKLLSNFAALLSLC